MRLPKALIGIIFLLFLIMIFIITFQIKNDSHPGEELTTRPNSTSVPVNAEDWRKLCTTMKNFAEIIMERRQAGVPLSKIMTALVDSKPGYEDSLGWLIVTAYDEPKHSTEKMRKKSIEDFRNMIYLDCINEGKK